MYFHHVIHLVSAASGTHNTGAAGVMSESICCVSWSTEKQMASLVGISEVCVFSVAAWPLHVRGSVTKIFVILAT